MYRIERVGLTWEVQVLDTDGHWRWLRRCESKREAEMELARLELGRG